MSFVDEMRGLREEIESGKESRTRRIKEIKEDLSAFRKDATQKRKEDLKALTKKINQRISDLKEDAANLRKAARASQKAIQAEQVEARAAFWGKKGGG